MDQLDPQTMQELRVDLKYEFTWQESLEDPGNEFMDEMTDEEILAAAERAGVDVEEFARNCEAAR